ncbi:hypothetical protein CFOL_v3_04698, partial [Cephalotus follicularis]
MGKNGKLQQGQQQQQQRHHDEEDGTNRGSSRFFSERCSMGLSTILTEFNIKCVVVLILSLSVFLSAIFWILPLHHMKSGFDAKDAIKLSATVQASFRLRRPVLEVFPYIGRLEYDIYGEIGVPDTKVAVLSMHQSDVSNWTDVVFGVLSDPINVQINPVSLSVLKSSLIELFLEQSNLTLTTSIFGQPSMFEILKFPGGITVIPMQSASIWQMPQILFNFTLNNSITEIQENLVELKDQLKLGLHLRPYENVYVQLTNQVGCTIEPLVTVQASVMSDLGSLLPLRLKQLAQTITNPANNLGLDNSLFGNVKSISLSSYLKGTLHSNLPSPSPAPLPGPSISPSPSLSPSPSPDIQDHPPCLNGRASPPSQQSHPHAPSPLTSPAPSTITADPPRPCPHSGPSIPPSYSRTPKSNPIPHPAPVSSPSQSPEAPSPLPDVSFGSRPGQDFGIAEGPVPPSLAPSLMAPSPSCKY